MKVLVIGGGAAGLMAAGAALRQGHEVTVLEHMEKPAQKILVTGKGRCNVTNDCTAEEFLHHVRTNPRFLFSSLGAFPPAKTMELFESLGVELKVERGRRVFPVSDKAEEIRQALLRYAEGADIVRDGAKKSCCWSRWLSRRKRPPRRKIPATPKRKKARPGLPLCGRAGHLGPGVQGGRRAGGDGRPELPHHRFHRRRLQAGPAGGPHPRGACAQPRQPCQPRRRLQKMMGLALKNVTLTLHEDGKAIFEEQGEMLFTHFGISGPLTLSASSHLGDMKKHRYEAFIDLKPALSEEQLYDRITRDFALLANHAAQGGAGEAAAVQYAAGHGGPLGHRPGHQEPTRSPASRSGSWCSWCKHWRVSIDARGDLAHAVITSGGVSVREVDPKTMQSKKALGLYFAGEVLDVDAYTGGYNLQIAFCTAQSFANNLG